VVSADIAETVKAELYAAGEEVFVIGEVVAGERGCTVFGGGEVWSARGDWSATHNG